MSRSLERLKREINDAFERFPIALDLARVGIGGEESDPAGDRVIRIAARDRISQLINGD
jgi:hypothetical protein